MTFLIEPTVATSADGKRNAYTFWCDVLEQRPAYAACLKKIADRKSGRLSLSEECSVAISKKRCPALSMKKEETALDKAIYFIERSKATVVAAVAKVNAKVFKRVEPVAKKPADGMDMLAGISDNIYSDAINAAVKKASQEPKEQIEVKPGETLLEAARRMLGK